MKKVIHRILCLFTVILFLCGAALFLYPYITRFVSDSKANTAIMQFQSEIQDQKTDPDSKLQKLYDDMYAYNEEIYNNKQAGLKDQEAYEKAIFNLSDYGLSSDTFGYIEIPKIDVKLPIYLGATKANMALGATQLTYTSIPMNQKNTNAVIAAHRGYRGAAFFRYIDQLETGDLIYVTTPWEVLTYQVTQTEIIEKDDIQKIHIQDGKTMLTLSSCNPYTKNTHRYLVYAELVP